MADLIQEIELLRQNVISDYVRKQDAAKRLNAEHSQRNADFIAYVQSIEAAIEKRHAHAREALAHLAHVMGISLDPKTRVGPPPPLPHEIPMPRVAQGGR